MIRRLYKDWLESVHWIKGFRERHLTQHQFVCMLAFITGLAGAFAALILKNLIRLIEHSLTFMFTNGANWPYLVYPVIGILLAGLFVRKIIKDDIGHGVTKVLYAISRRKSIIKSHNMYSSVVASSVTIGMGGSVGAEAPVVLTGAAIGSNLGRVFKLDQHTLMILLGCGAAAGIAGIFKAPIAGLLFTIEVLMLDLTAYSIMPLLISSVTAASVAYIFEGPTPMFSFSHTVDFTVERIPWVILLGIICGFASLYFTRSTFWAEDFFRRFRSPWTKWAVGGGFLSFIIFILPPLYGEGYTFIQHIYNGDFRHILGNSMFYGQADSIWVFGLFIFLLIAFKAFATAATCGGGGCGGTFAPSLFVGNFVGFLFALLFNRFGFASYIPEQNFAVMGMAAVMSGVMHAPLMGVFLSAELTGRFDLFLPLLIASTLSYGTISLFEPYSIYTHRLAQKGELITHHKDKAVLMQLHIEDFINHEYQVVSPAMLLGDLVKVVSRSEHNTYPVCSHDGTFMGIITINEMRNIMFQPRLYERLRVSDIMIGPPGVVTPDMPMDKVMNLFDTTGVWNLPLVDNSGRYLGMLQKTKIYTTYRHVLQDFSED